jgi:hypothetical protein
LKSSFKMNSQELRALQEAYSQVYAPQELDEAEGSYGQTPKAQQKMGDLANKRRNTPASEYSERGEKKKKVDSASRHFNRMGNPDAGNRGKKSSRPYYPAGRKGMTQKDRDWSRGADEYGHSGYDGEGGGGSLPKGKKLERQKKTGVSESFDIYDIILSHLLDEGYADTQEAATAIMVNMSEEWREDIVEKTAMAKKGHDETAIRNKIAKSTGGGEAADRAGELADRKTFGHGNSQARNNLARAQKGDFRKTTSSSPGLHGYGYKSDDSDVKAKQAARGAQRGALTPKEKKQFGR